MQELREAGEIRGHLKGGERGGTTTETGGACGGLIVWMGWVCVCVCV